MSGNWTFVRTREGAPSEPAPGRRSLAHGIALLSLGLLLLVGLTALPTSAEGGSLIRTGDTNSGAMAIGYPHQRKLVRDASGYWYAVWMEQDGTGSTYDILFAKSNDTEGTSWPTPVKVAGNGGLVLSGYDCRYPAMDIDRTNGKIHLIWVDMGSAGYSTNSLYYTKLNDLNNWSVNTGWTQIQGGTSPRYNVVDSWSYAGGDPSQGASIAVDSSGNVHVAYMADPVGMSYEWWPYYRYGSTSTGWASAIKVSVFSTGTETRYPTVEVTSGNYVHVFWNENAGSGWEYVYNRYTTDFTNFYPSYDNTVVNVFGHNLSYLSAAADGEGRIYVTCQDSSDSDICGAYSINNGTSWTERENIDQLGWSMPAVGVRLDSGITTDLIVSPNVGTDPDEIYSWKGGDPWSAAEVYTNEGSDQGVASLEKRVAAEAASYGFLYYDYVSSSSSGIYLGHVYLVDLVLADHSSGQVTDQIGAVNSVNDANLFRFSLKNTTASAITVDQIVFQLTGVVGIETADLSDLRINDGTSDVSTGGVASIASGTGTITFTGNFSVPAGSTVNYTLIGDVVTPIGGDRITVGLGTANITLLSGTKSGFPPASVTQSRDYPYSYPVTAGPDDSFSTVSADNASNVDHYNYFSTQRSTATTSRINAGIRFQNATIPQGSIINRAEVRGYIYDTSYDDAWLTIFGHLANDSADFNTNYYINSTTYRPRTTASTVWQQANMGVGWQDKDVTAIVQEIVNQGTWEAGNKALTLLFIADNASGTGNQARFYSRDYGSLYPILNVDYTLPNTVIIGSHSGGQAPDGFDGNLSRNDVDLYRFSLFNTEGSAVTVDQIVFSLSAVSGIETADLSDLRIWDGTSYVVAGGTPSISSGTGTITFTTNWTIPAASTVHYTLRGDVANLVKDDTLTLSLVPAGVTLVSGDVGGSVSATATHTADDAANIAEHGSGPLTDQLDGAPTQNDRSLFRFRLVNATVGDLTVDQVVLQLSSVTGIADTDLTDLRINNGTIDVSTGGLASIAAGSGTITFAGDFTLPAGATVDYTVTGDVASVVKNDTLTVGLPTGNVTLVAGAVGGTAPTGVTHTADDAATLGSHALGQVVDQFDSAPSKNDVALFRLQLVNTTGVALTVDQVQFQLSAITGLVTTDLSDLRLHDGSGDVATGGAPAIAGTTGTITFTGDFTLPAGATVDYALVGDAANLGSGDTVTVALGATDVVLAAGSLGGSAPASVTHAWNLPSPSSSADDSWDTQSSDNALTNMAGLQVQMATNGTTGLRKHGGVRFPGIYVPKGSTIGTATLYVYVESTVVDDPQLTIKGHAVGDAPDFATDTQIYRRAQTTASSIWRQTSIGSGWKTWPVTTIVQELVNRTDWATGNDVALLFIADQNGTPYSFQFRSFDNAGGSFAPYLVISFTPPTTLVLGNHASGQVPDQFDGGVSQDDKDLFRFRIENTTGSTVTVDQIAFDLAAVSGILTGDLADLRIHDGTSDVVTGGTPNVSGATGTITFTTDWTIPAGATRDYTLRGDATSLVKDDTLTISLPSSGITPVSGDVGGSVSATATHTVDDTALLGSHASGQLTDQLDGRSPHVGVDLFRFQLQSNSTADVTIDELVFQLSSVAGIAAGDLTSLVVNDGTSDVTTGGAPSIASGSGTITFTGDFALPAGQTRNYVLRGNLANLVNGDTLTIALGSGNIALTAGNVAGTAPTDVTHTADHALSLSAHDSGQVVDQWNSSANQADKELYWFKLANDTASTVSVDQLVFRLTSVAGILSGELTNLEIAPEGGGTVGGAGVAAIAGSTGTITFSTSFDLTPGQSVNYKLIGDAANLYAADTITVGLVTGDVTPSGGSVGGINPATATHATNGPTIQVQITDTNDDVYERNSTIWNSPYPVRNSVDSTGNRMPGLRFPGVALAQGATIASATVEGYVYDTALGDDFHTTVYGHATDNAQNWVDLADVDGRARTTASTNVDQDNVGVGWHAVDVTSIVQEIVDRVGWASGNAMAFMYIPPPPGTTTHGYYHSVDTGASYAARLTIEYMPAITLVLGQYSPGGQVTDQFDGATSQNDKELFRFQLANPTGNDLTVTQVAFQLSAIAGIVQPDLSNLRIDDGSGNVGGTASVSIAGATGTITFTDDFTIGAGQTRNYALIGDAANLLGLDTMTLALGTGDIALVTGSVSGTAPANAMHTAEYTAALGSHGSGQLTDQFDGSAAHADRGLFRFRLTNNTQAAVTVDQLVLPLSSVVGIFDADLTDLRVNNGTADVTTGGVASIAAGSGTIAFTGDFVVPAASTVDYTLTADVAGLASGDTLTIALGTANVTLADGSVGGSAPSSATHTADHTVLLAAHGSGQVADQFDGAVSQNDKTLYRFRLTNDSNATATVTQVVFPLSSVAGIASGDLSDLWINNGSGDLPVPGVPSVAGATGTITFTFTTEWTIAASATVDYTVRGDFASLANGDTLTIGLGTGHVTLAAGSVGGSAPASASHTADHTALLAEHASGQVPDALFTEDAKSNAPLFRFRLQNNTTGDLTLTQVQLQLSQVNGIATGDLSGLRLNDGTADVGGSGTPSISGGGGTGTGTITFSGSITLPASQTVSYTLFGDLANLAALDKMTVALGTADVTLSAGSVGGTAPSNVTHYRDQPSIDVEIADTNDDAWEDQNVSPTADVTSTTSSNIVVATKVSAGDRRHAGFRFQNVGVAQGSTLNRAVLQVYLPSGTTSYVYADVYGDDSASPANFATTPDINGANNPALRTLTTASEPLSIGAWGAGWRYVDVTSVVQEIVSRPDWANGNPLALLMVGRSESKFGDTAYIEDYSAAGTNHARLSIDFDNAALLGTHAWGQVVDQFDAKVVESDQDLFRFRIYNESATVLNVTGLVFRLTGVVGIASGDLSDLRIMKSTANVATGGTALIDGTEGTITFASGFSVAGNGYGDFTLVGDAANLASGDTLTISLATADVATAQGPVGRHLPLPTAVTHAYGARSVMVSYSEATSSPPLKFSAHQAGSGYPAPGSQAATITYHTSPGPYTLHWKVAKTSPDLSRQAVLFSENYPAGKDYIYVSVYDGTNWDDGSGAPYGDAWAAPDRTGYDGVRNVRSFDAAYEALSQRLLVVNGTSNTVNAYYYYRFDGSSWWDPGQYVGFGNYVAPYGGVGTQEWFRLTPMPNTNQIALITIANSSDRTAGAVQAAIWDGDRALWRWTQTLSFPSGGQVGSATENIDAQYVLGGSNAGEAIFVWSNNGTLYWNKWNPTTAQWGPGGTIGTLADGAKARWLRLECKPAGDNMVLAVGDDLSRLVTFTYDGDTRAWSSSSSYHTTTLSGDPTRNRPFDLTWDILSGLGSSNVLLVYSDSTGVNSAFSSTGGASFNSPIVLDATPAYWIQVERAPNPTPHLAYQDVNNDLQAFTWNGSSWDVAGTDISTALDPATSNDAPAFGLAEAPLVGGPALPTTAVRLAEFRATGYDGEVLVEWATGMELDNLGFHLYRAPSMDGPWERLTEDMILGLGSSPEGKRYSFLDAPLRNGATYYYRLEDFDRSGKVTSHGPVSATPLDGAGTPGEGGETPGETPGEGESTPAGWTEHGDPRDVALRLVSRDRTSVTFELRTGGFYSLAQEDGSVRLFVPGFIDLAEPGYPTLPTRRTWTEAVPGLGARVQSVSAEELLVFDGLVPPTAGAPEAVAMRDGTYQKAFRPVATRPLSRGLFPREQARVLQTAFQGDTKKAYVELLPLRFDSARGRIVLARRMLVTVLFDGVVPGETGLGGSSGRSLTLKRQPPADGRLIARFATRQRGLHAVAWEDLLAAVSSPGFDLASSALMLDTASLRLSRKDELVPFHVEPRPDRFVPGSTLFFLADDVDSAYNGEAVFELAVAQGGRRMALGASSRGRSDVAAPLDSLLASLPVEQNLDYLPGLLDAPDPWLWNGFLPGSPGMEYSFSLPTLATGAASVSVRLMGGSDSGAALDHRVAVSLNGTPLGEAAWDGMRPFTFSATVPEGVLAQGPNTLHLEGRGEPSSAVYLDRFSLEYPRALVPLAGALEGVATHDGIAHASGFEPGAIIIEVSPRGPRWMGRSPTASPVFSALAEHRYLAVCPTAVVRPLIRPASLTSLRDPANRADWILVAPRELLPAAEPLLLHRRAQGLATAAVAIEDVFAEFGSGETSPDALKDFLAFAYHHWGSPSPRYVLLLGDATYDPWGFFSATARRDLVPSPFVRSTFLWTPSDPLLASVNGSDILPDVALGRIPASTLDEAAEAVQKILDFELAGRHLTGSAVLVADNPDAAGDFDANVNDIASLLPSRTVRKVLLSQLDTSSARAAVRSAFDSGASLMSYVGHGSASLWASEGILRSPDISTLAPQTAQPLLLTMTCSNGYFVSPFGNSLVERLALAPDKGAIAAFSPTGLSLDSAAHLYHRAVVAELEAGPHTRLGDVVLAAQAAYTQTGAFPELLSIYHLFGDPALKVR